MSDLPKAMQPGDRVPMSWEEYEALGEFWGEYIDGRLIAGPVRDSRHQNIVMNVTTLLAQAVGSLHAIHQWGWKPADDEFIADVMVFDDETADIDPRDIRLLSTPLLVVEVLSSDLAVDMVRKAAKYAAAGLVRYWIIDPEDPRVIVYHLVEGVLVERSRHGPGAPVTLEVGPAQVTFDPADLVR